MAKHLETVACLIILYLGLRLFIFFIKLMQIFLPLIFYFFIFLQKFCFFLLSFHIRIPEGLMVLQANIASFSHIIAFLYRLHWCRPLDQLRLLLFIYYYYFVYIYLFHQLFQYILHFKLYLKNRFTVFFYNEHQVITKYLFNSLDKNFNYHLQ